VRALTLVLRTATQCVFRCFITHCFVSMGTSHGICKEAMALRCTIFHQETECFVIKPFVFKKFIATFINDITCFLKMIYGMFVRCEILTVTLLKFQALWYLTLCLWVFNDVSKVRSAFETSGTTHTHNDTALHPARL
jgi:hypothetical protein